MPERAELDVVVERLAVGGDGIAREPEGRVVFVEGGLPGEHVRVSVTRRARDYWRAEVREVLTASPSRIDPPCPEVARGCGGCGWMHIDPTAQLELKVAMVRDALVRQGRLADAAVTARAAVAPLRYRTTARFAGAENGRLGLRRPASNDVVELGGCLVVDPAIEALLPGVRIPAGSELTIRMSRQTGQRTAMLTGSSADPGGNQRVDGLPPDVRLGAEAWLLERVAGIDLRVSAASFFQSSPESAALLVSAVSGALADSGVPVQRWLDLYGGIGLFAATVLPGSDVTVVEQSASACSDARHNLSDRRARVVESAVEEWSPEDCGAPFDAVVADPSRRGLGAEGADVVMRTGASVVVLVSCDAASLGRDTALLTARGYAHAGSEVLDLFPGTPHLEVVTRFARSAP